VRSRVAACLAGLLLLGSTACSEDPPSPPDRSSAQATKSDRQTDGPSGTTTTDRPSAEPMPSAPPLTESFVPAGSARELARRLATAEDLVRAEGTDEQVRRAAAFETQLLYRQLARTEAWAERVRDGLPARYRADLTAHVTARRSLRSVTTTLSDELPAWEIVEPAPTPDLLRFYREGERTYGVRWEVLAAINLVETGFGKIRGVSTAGAQGPMQFIPSTWAAYGMGGNIHDPRDAILGAANYLHASGAPGDVRGALYAYNPSAHYVNAVLAYAERIRRDPRSFFSYYSWQVYVRTTAGTRRITGPGL
jgi:hypothetical protein